MDQLPIIWRSPTGKRDLKSAKPYYQYVIENYPDTERARTSQNYVDAQE